MCFTTFLSGAFLVFSGLLAPFSNRLAEMPFLWLQTGKNAFAAN
jgi:hypothetical protein